MIIQSVALYRPALLADPALARAVAELRARLGGDRVDVTIRYGAIGRHLVELAERASLLVVEAGPAASHVTAHAGCPVVVVRPTRAVHGPFAGHVVVGVADEATAAPALRFGFDHAARHRIPLAAVHIGLRATGGVWTDDDLLETHLFEEAPELVMLDAAVEPWRRRHPDVAVKRAVCPGRPSRTLVEVADGARLLVVGDRGRAAAARALLGSVSRSVVAHARGTAAVVHEGEQAQGDLGLSGAGVSAT